MGLPAHKSNSQSKRFRASHFALKKQMGRACPNCGAPMLPHRACNACGMYRGKKAVNTEKRAARRLKRTGSR